MKIWFDLSNSPHINLFYHLIRDLEGSGHEVIITCRPLANTVDLLEQKGLRYTVIGEHYGKRLHRKVFGFPIRVWQLRRFLKGAKPDLAVSQSSFHSPLVARLLGIPSIYTNDNEHALGNIPSFLFATQVLIPENLSIDKVVRQGAARKKISMYAGVKEGIFLWPLGEEIDQQRTHGVNGNGKIYVRPEPLTAQYYKGDSHLLDEALIALQEKYQVVVLPRDQNQSEHYRQAKFASVTVPDKPLKFMDIAKDCTLFIGAGGSMTREMAILGIPTICTYQGELLDVDRYLLAKGLMHYDAKISYSNVVSFMKDHDSSATDRELLQKGKKAYDFFKSEILKYNKL